MSGNVLVKGIAQSLYNEILELGREMPTDSAGWEAMIYSLLEVKGATEEMQLAVALVVSDPDLVKRTIAMAKSFWGSGDPVLPSSGDELTGRYLGGSFLPLSETDQYLGDELTNRFQGFLREEKKNLKTFGDLLTKVEDTSLDPMPSVSEEERRAKDHRLIFSGIGWLWDFKRKKGRRHHCPELLKNQVFDKETLCGCGCGQKVVDLKIRILEQAEAPTDCYTEKALPEEEDWGLQEALRLSLESVQGQERQTVMQKKVTSFVESDVPGILSQKTFESREALAGAIRTYIEAQRIVPAEEVKEFVSSVIQELEKQGILQKEQEGAAAVHIDVKQKGKAPASARHPPDEDSD